MGLLQKRESVIADHDWRERNAATHLDALKEVFIAIDNWSVQHSDWLDPKLSHYLNNASFAKALDHLQQSNSAN